MKVHHNPNHSGLCAQRQRDNALRRRVLRESQPTAIARRYIRDQFTAMKIHGSGHVRQSRAEYWKLVTRIVSALESVRRA